MADAANPQDTAMPAALDRKILVVGANHKSSAMMLRDRLFVEDKHLPFVLEQLRQKAGLDQAVLLSTCDRVEVEAAVENPEQTADAIKQVLAEHAEMDPADLEGVYTLHDADAVRHMFAVAGALDSLMIGEPQVLGQVKAGYRMSRDLGMMGAALDSVYQAAFATAKRIRTETTIGEKPVSIATAAVQLAGDLHGALKRCSGLLVGAGEMGELIAADLRSAGLDDLTVIHPLEARAATVARTLECHAAPYEAMGALMAEADIVIMSLGRRSHVLTQDMVQAAIKKRRRKPMFLVDTAVPGDIEPSVERLDEAFVYDLDDLEKVAMAGRASRENEAGPAWAIIDEELNAFLRGRAEREAVPVLNRLRSAVDQLRAEALIDAGGDPEKATRLLANRLLHRPSERIRKLAADDPDELKRVEALLDRIFDLGDDKRKGGGG